MPHVQNRKDWEEAMRIVSGELRGHVVNAPEGRDTRPTTDRVREALFSSLYSLLGGFEGVTVLDAFAGSGALGLEALSRGAKQAVFFDSDAHACKVIRANVETCHMQSHAEVRNADVFKLSANAGVSFDLVFLDPPYALEPEKVVAFIIALGEGGRATGDTMFVYEHALASAKDVQAACESARLQVVKEKKYGKTAVTFLRLPQ